MVLQYDPQNGPVIRAAKMALETGNANYVLIWVSEESANTLKNLVEKTCCERSSRKYLQNRAIDWYFETVNRLHHAVRWPHYLSMKFEGFDEDPIVQMVQRAVETGDAKEMFGVIPPERADDFMQRFHHVMDKRNYDIHNIADGRAYVSAFYDFTGYVHNLFSEIPDKGDR